MNLYQLSGVYSVDEPERMRSRPATAIYLYSHKNKFSSDEFSSMLDPLFEKHDGILTKIDNDLRTILGFEAVKPIHISFSGGTVSKESLEEIMGRKF